jgi:hypothetical protein
MYDIDFVDKNYQRHWKFMLTGELRSHGVKKNMLIKSNQRVEYYGEVFSQ